MTDKKSLIHSTTKLLISIPAAYTEISAFLKLSSQQILLYYNCYYLLKINSMYCQVLFPIAILIKKKKKRAVVSAAVGTEATHYTLLITTVKVTTSLGIWLALANLYCHK